MRGCLSDVHVYLCLSFTFLRTHAAKLPWKCEICGRRIKKKCLLITHMTFHITTKLNKTTANSQLQLPTLNGKESFITYYSQLTCLKRKQLTKQYPSLDHAYWRSAFWTTPSYLGLLRSGAFYGFTMFFFLLFLVQSSSVPDKSYSSAWYPVCNIFFDRCV